MGCSISLFGKHLWSKVQSVRLIKTRKRQKPMLTQIMVEYNNDICMVLHKRKCPFIKKNHWVRRIM